MTETGSSLLKPFSREAFEKSTDPAALGAELEALLRARLEIASDRWAEAHRIIEDLRQAGHVLWSLDESDSFSTWGDSYVNPPPRTRFFIDMRWPSEDEPSQPVEVEITFGLCTEDGRLEA